MSMNPHKDIQLMQAYHYSQEILPSEHATALTDDGISRRISKNMCSFESLAVRTSWNLFDNMILPRIILFGCITLCWYHGIVYPTCVDDLIKRIEAILQKSGPQNYLIIFTAFLTLTTLSSRLLISGNQLTSHTQS